MKEKEDEYVELQDIIIDVKDPKVNNKEEEKKNTLLLSKIEINDFISKEESDIIKDDIALLKEMGYDQKIINKVYIIISPLNIETAIDLMTPINGVYHHDFYENIYQSINKNLCFICSQPRNRHINSTPADSDEVFDDIINNNHNNNKDMDFSSNDNMCKICYEEVEEKQKKFNTLICGHLCCTHCWMNYLKTKISEAKVEQIKCVEYKCNQILPEEFILKHIKEDNILLNKYEKFKLRTKIKKPK